MFCVNCGHNCPDDATYCIGCGRPIPESARRAAGGSGPSGWSDVGNESPWSQPAVPWSSDSASGSWAPPEKITVQDMGPSPGPASMTPSAPQPLQSWGAPPPGGLGAQSVGQRNFSAYESNLPSGNDPRFMDQLGAWNWGAFFFSWIWALSHRMYVWAAVIFVLAPCLGPLPCIVLALVGNKEAWKNRPFASVQEFQATQRAWTMAGLILVGVFFGLGFLAAVLDSGGY